MKEDGIFVCQGCGMKYSADEAKKLLVEVDGSAPKKSGTDKVTNMITLAQNAIDQANNKEAEDYSNKVLEIDSNNARAWLIKGQAVGWQSTLSNVRMAEMASCFEHAMENASEDESEEFKLTIKTVSEGIAKAFLKLTTDNFGNYPSDDNVNNIQLACTSMLDLSLKMIILHIDWDSDSINDYFSQRINEAAVAGSNKADGDYGPDRSDKNKYAYQRWMDQSDNCLTVLEKAMVFANTKTQVETIVKNYRIINQNVIGSCCYKFEVNSYSSGYVQDLSLTETAKNLRRNSISRVESTGNKKIQEIKDKAREKYWQDHADKKAALESEKEEKNKRITVLKGEIKNIRKRVDPEIDKLKRKKDEVLPEEKLVEEQQLVIAKLYAEINGLGLFKFKEKKALKARISDEEQPKLEQLKSAANAKRNEINAQYDKDIAKLDEEDAPQRKEIEKCKKRIKEINAEFAKDR